MMLDRAWDIVSSAATLTVGNSDKPEFFLKKLDEAIGDGRFTVEVFDSKNSNRWCVRVRLSDNGAVSTLTKIWTRAQADAIAAKINERREAARQ